MAYTCFSCMRMVCKLVIAQMMFHIWLYLFFPSYFFRLPLRVHINNLPEMCWLLLLFFCFSFVIFYLFIYFSFCIELSHHQWAWSVQPMAVLNKRMHWTMAEAERNKETTGEEKLVMESLGDGYNLWNKRKKHTHTIQPLSFYM